MLQQLLADKQPHEQLWTTALNFQVLSDEWMNGEKVTVAAKRGNPLLLLFLLTYLDSFLLSFLFPSLLAFSIAFLTFLFISSSNDIYLLDFLFFNAHFAYLLLIPFIPATFPLVVYPPSFLFSIFLLLSFFTFFLAFIHLPTLPPSLLTTPGPSDPKVLLPIWMLNTLAMSST